MLNKIKKIKIKEIKIKAGNIIKYLDKKNPEFKKFGEIYFNEIKKGYFKGWNLHKKYKSVITVPYGNVEFTFMDLKRKRKKIVNISRKNPSILIIPPKIWFKFRSKTKLSIIVNTIENIHSRNETLKLSL